MKRKPAETLTATQKAMRACRAHLRDLRAYEWPPADVALRPVPIPQRLSGSAESGCGSSAQSCAEA